MLCKFVRQADGTNQCSRPGCRFVDSGESAPDKTFRECPSPLAGIGNAIAWVIDFATFHQGKKMADLFARKVLRKKGCGCAKRQSAMNAWGEKWLAILWGWWLGFRSLLNAVGRKIIG
jgi:hypothetical protein